MVLQGSFALASDLWLIAIASVCACASALLLARRIKKEAKAAGFVELSTESYEAGSRPVQIAVYSKVLLALFRFPRRGAFARHHLLSACLPRRLFGTRINAGSAWFSRLQDKDVKVKVDVETKVAPEPTGTAFKGTIYGISVDGWISVGEIAPRSL